MSGAGGDEAYGRRTENDAQASQSPHTCTETHDGRTISQSSDAVKPRSVRL
jgi:hypothetical protein